jgi:hypothetical protein
MQFHTPTGRKRAIVLMLIRVALGVIFLYSGVEKIAHPYIFLANVYDFELTGPGLGMLVAMVLPWLELFLAIALIFNLFPGGALLGGALLGILFVGVQASAIVRGLSVNCGCFGPDEAKLVGLFTFARTCFIALAAFAAWLIYLNRSAGVRCDMAKLDAPVV